MTTPKATLLETLAAGPATSADLMSATGLSQPVLSRSMTRLEQQGLTLRMGAARSTRYGLLRKIPRAGSTWPVFQVDELGDVREIGQLSALQPRHYVVKSAKAGLRGLTDYVPYYLHDQRPGGFIGRSVSRLWPELELPARVIDWSDDHYLVYLTRRGFDTVSDLLVGVETLDRYLAANPARPVVPSLERSVHYPILAEAALAGNLAGSSAHGEHPKFATALECDSTIRHVLVKFSPPRATHVGQRWSDLLLAEHIAHEHLAAHGVDACRSNYFQFGDRAYLEVERFDRIGDSGRRGVVSLLAIDSARYGGLDRWPTSAARLAKDGFISAADLDEIRLREAFAQLIANNDRHFGNLAFFDRYDGSLQNAPVYDMLPMLFAPANEQLVERSFEMPHPTSETLAAWARAQDLAEGYWETICADRRISEEFRTIGEQALTVLRRRTPARKA